MRKYIVTFFLFASVVAIIIYFTGIGITSDELKLRWMIFGYFSVLTVAFHYGTVKTTQSRPQVFIRYFMAATSIKLLLHLGVIVIYSVLNRPLAITFIITFMIMYFLFTIFEVILLARKEKK